MSWLTFAWSACAAACVLLALIHLLIWIKQGSGRVYLLSSSMAFAAGANAILELILLQSETIERYGTILIWGNFAVFIILISMIWFIDLHLTTARRWLTIAITVVWIIALPANFLSPGSLVFSQIDELRQLSTFWGEQYTVASGSANLWKLLPDISILLITAHVLDATIRAWRKNPDRHGAVVGSSILFFIVVAGIHTPLVDAGVIATPYMVSFAFLAIVVALSYELVNEAIKVPRYAEELQSVRRNMERMERTSILGELSSSLAHELNQPLAAILSNTQAAQRLLRKDPPELGEVREILSDIVRDDKRAGDVIHGLRRLLKREDLKQEPVQLNKIIVDVVNLLNGELKAQNIELQRRLHRRLPMVKAGRVELQQVIMNLIMNAIHAMAESAADTRTITVHTNLNGHVRCVIEDSGPGIDPDILDKIFDPLLSTRVDGLGMGLAICQRIVESCDGQIEAENMPAGGARFSITLPPLEQQ